MAASGSAWMLLADGDVIGPLTFTVDLRLDWRIVGTLDWENDLDRVVKIVRVVALTPWGARFWDVTDLQPAPPLGVVHLHFDWAGVYGADAALLDEETVLRLLRGET